MRQSGLLLCCCLASAVAYSGDWSDLWLTPDQQGQRLLDSNRPAEAARRFEDPRRQAYADLAAGHYGQAARLLAPFKDVDSQYNRGNALARSGQLQQALAAYDAALAQAPGNRDVRHNRDLVARALQQQNARRQQQGNGSGSSSAGSRSAGAQSGSGQPPGDRSDANDSSQQSGDPHSGQGNDANRSPADRQQGEVGGTSASAPPGGQQGANGDSSESGGSQDDAEQAQRDAAAGADSRQRQQRSVATTAGTSTDNQSAGTDSARVARSRAEQTAPKAKSEQALALEQWLRRIPEDPGGLLRRKFLIEHMMKQQGIEP